MFKEGTVVISSAGKDKGRLLAVVKSEENRVFLCDGKERPIDRPKSKNIRHVEKTDFCVAQSDLATNRALKKALRRLDAEINGNT